MKLNSNVTSWRASNILQANESAFSKATGRLSSGYKINSSGDDPVGMVISNKMNTVTKSLDKATQNSSSAVNVIQTADGAMTEIKDIIHRLKELSIQSANGTNTDADRQAMQAEMTQLTAEVEHIVQSTEYNGQKLLNGDLDVALAVDKPDHPEIEVIPWMREEIILAVPSRYQINQELADYAYDFDAFLKRNEPGGRKSPVPLIRFLNMPFLLLNEQNDIHARTMKICGRAGFSPKVKLVLSQMMTAYYLVCEGQGVTLLRDTIPEYVTPNDNIVFYQLDDPLAFRSIYLSYPKKELPSMHRELIDYLIDKGDAEGLS